MGSKRRYKSIKDTEKIYHDQFDNLRVSSIVLNKNARVRSDKVVNFNARSDLKKLLAELEVKQGTLQNSLIMIEEKQKQENNASTKTGKLSRPNRQLVEERLRIEGTVDVLEEEVEELNKLIGDIGEQAEERKNKYVLKHGPVGVGVLRGNVLSVLDGQNIEAGKNGLKIKDDRSVYNGVLVTSYYERIVKPWKIARSCLKAEQVKLEKKLAGQGRREEFADQWEKRRSEIFKDNPDWIKLFAIKVDGCPAMPDPKFVK